jgi:hypothetical protein
MQSWSLAVGRRFSSHPSNDLGPLRSNETDAPAEVGVI